MRFEKCAIDNMKMYNVYKTANQVMTNISDSKAVPLMDVFLFVFAFRPKKCSLSIQIMQLINTNCNVKRF